MKYNYQLKRADVDVWIDVKTYVCNGFIIYEVENWGTPIAKDEISSRRIFMLGRRGTYAATQGRTGSGIGLSDAEMIAIEHGGYIEVQSNPAREKGGGYNQPYITQVCMAIPIYSRVGALA